MVMMKDLAEQDDAPDPPVVMIVAPPMDHMNVAPPVMAAFKAAPMGCPVVSPVTRMARFKAVAVTFYPDPVAPVSAVPRSLVAHRAVTIIIVAIAKAVVIPGGLPQDGQCNQRAK
jgi:hypothetical protein